MRFYRALSTLSARLDLREPARVRSAFAVDQHRASRLSEVAIRILGPPQGETILHSSAASHPRRASIAPSRLPSVLALPIALRPRSTSPTGLFRRPDRATVWPRPRTEFIGEIGESEKSEFLGNARAVLFPIDWPEPFGLVMIEAMACGTPVIGFNHGSVSEVISDGVSGFIVDRSMRRRRC